jgi:hypothetical protein
MHAAVSTALASSMGLPQSGRWMESLWFDRKWEVDFPFVSSCAAYRRKGDGGNFSALQNKK